MFVNKNILFVTFAIFSTVVEGQISPIVPINSQYSYGLYNPYTSMNGYSSYYNRINPYSSLMYPSSLLSPISSGYSNYVDGISSLGYLNPSLNSLMYRNGISNSYLNSLSSGIPSSYMWNTRYGLGGLSGISGYEGSLTPNTFSNYIQPDVSIPPLGVPDSTSLTRNLLTSQYIPGSGSGMCKDQMTQCAVYASTGQCSSSPILMTKLCPISCGIGCATSDIGSVGVNNLNTISTMASIDSPFTTLPTRLNGGYLDLSPSNILLTPVDHLNSIPTLDHTSIIYDSVASYKFDNIMKYLNALYSRFQNNINILPNLYNYENSPKISSSLLLPPIINSDKDSHYLLCKDSHVDGCPSWSAMGYCSRFPTFMNTYCRGSCNSCENKNTISNGILVNDKDFITSFSGGYGSYSPYINSVRSGIYPLTERKPSTGNNNGIPSLPTLKTNNNDEDLLHISRKQRTNRLRELLEMSTE
uniref:ShKT domain-containing protein n=1 Tax=Strongyloides papillosus TaxID=174720 RepID=A0A0N5B7F0_STREA